MLVTDVRTQILHRNQDDDMCLCMNAIPRLCGRPQTCLQSNILALLPSLPQREEETCSINVPELFFSRSHFVKQFIFRNTKRLLGINLVDSLNFNIFCSLSFLPPIVLTDAPVAELHDLFCKKLQQCCVLFDFLDCVADLKGKEIKRAALNELVESVATSRGVLIEPLYPEAIKMVRDVRKSKKLK